MNDELGKLRIESTENSVDWHSSTSQSMKLEDRIRLVQLEDRPEWVRMRDALWPGSRADHEKETTFFLTHADPAQATFVVDRLDGTLGGFLEAGCRSCAESCTTSPVAYIEGWYIDPDLRRLGLGAALVRAAEDWARSRGLTEIASDAEIENEASIMAHKALGYEEVERIVCFRKTLSNPARDKSPGNS